MEQDRFDRQLRLLMTLTQNRRQTVEELSESLKMTKRSIYRYMGSFRQAGFILRKEGTRYSVDPASPFFEELGNYARFTEDEAVTISQVLNSVMSNSPQVRHLRQKLAHLYDFKVLTRHLVDDRMAHNLTVIYQAIMTERVAILHQYSSPSSGKVSDRIVEPYLFLPENNEVRCYEISTGQNKTFKLTRAKRVEMVDLLWTHKDAHEPFYQDLFHFTGEKRFPVKLLLGQLATNLLLEEYPAAETQLKQQADGRHLFTTEVCSYKGIGRFVLGLYEDIEIVDSPEFAQYMRERIQNLTQKIAQ